MSILPSNEPRHLHILDEALEGRWQFDIVKNPLNPSWCEAKYLPFIAKAYDIDISLYHEAQAREILQYAIWDKTKIGTLGAVKKVVQGFDPDAVVYRWRDASRYDGSYRHDGTITRRDFGMNHWAQYRVDLSRPMSLSQAQRLKALLIATAPARCQLVGWSYQATLIHNGAIKRNNTYTYGGYSNG